MNCISRYIITLLLTLCIPFIAAKAENASKNIVKIGIMLPLHNVDGDGVRMIEYYRGMLLAVDELKREGISTDVHAWNVPADADIRTTLLNDAAANCDLIFGPLYSNQVAALAGFCKSYGIKLVIPFSINSDAVKLVPNVYQIYQDDNQLNTSAIDAFIERFSKYQPVFVDCADKQSTKGAFTSALRARLDKEDVAYRVTSLKSSDDDFFKAFSAVKRNVVVLNTGRSPELGQVLQKLEALNALYPGRQVSLFGYNEWFMYLHPYVNAFYKFDTYIPTTYYYNESSSQVKELETKYVKWFHEPMQQALPRFALTGYDQAQFFIRGLVKYGKKFTGTRAQNEYKALQTPLQFKAISGGGYKNTTFELIHYTPSQSIESISY